VAVTLTRLKAELNITTSTSDDELQGKLDAAVAWAERYLGRPLSGTKTYTLEPSASGTLVLPALYAGTVTEVTDPSGAVVIGYTYDADLGLIRLPQYSRTGWWTVTVAAGITDPDVENAVLIIAAHLWETQRGPASPGPLRADDLDGPVGAGYAIPHRARDLLAMLRVSGLA
jgi:hypothetical protein